MRFHLRAAFFLLLAAIGLVACSVSEDLTESERALLLTEADLRREPTPALAGKYQKVSRIDKSRELSYVYEKEGSGLYLSNTLTVDTSAANALVTEGAQKTGLMIGLRVNGVVEEPIAQSVKYGDRSSLTILKKDGRPMGNVFTAVAGKKVYVVIFSGIYFDDAAAFDSFIAGKIDAILKYDPAQ